AAIAVHAAAFRNHALARGEKGVVLVVAADRVQAKITFDYIRALLEHPLLEPHVLREVSERIDLTNRTSIAIATASYRTIRGRTVIACCMDEVCFWRSEDSAEPDAEVLAAIRPAMANVPNALLVAISSPHSRRGIMWRAYSKHYGKDSDTLVV